MRLRRKMEIKTNSSVPNLCDCSNSLLQIWSSQERAPPGGDLGNKGAEMRSWTSEMRKLTSLSKTVLMYCCPVWSSGTCAWTPQPCQKKPKSLAAYDLCLSSTQPRVSFLWSWPLWRLFLSSCTLQESSTLQRNSRSLWLPIRDPEMSRNYTPRQIKELSPQSLIFSRLANVLLAFSWC